MISWLLAMSRLPVGSSANNTDGVVAMARAMATPLLLSPGELAGGVGFASCKPHLFESLARQGFAFFRRYAPVHQGQFHIFHGRGPVQQVESLEYKAQVKSAQGGQLFAAHMADFHPAKGVLARCGGIQASKDVHAGGFARA